MELTRLASVLMLMVIFATGPTAQADGGGGFYPLARVPMAPKNLARAYDAAIQVGNCSAVILSPDGYVATALHCIEDCLRPRWGYDPQIRLQFGAREGYFDFLRIDEQIPSRFSCPDDLVNQLTVFTYEMGQPRFVWLGRGRQAHTNEKIAEISDTEFAQLQALTEDVVILKYDLPADHKPLPCLRVANRSPIEPEPVWTIGFPTTARRASGFNSDGVSKYVSFGSTRRSIEEDPVLDKFAQSLAPHARDVFWTRERGIWDVDSLLLTAIDAVSGNSGGMMIDVHGELAAILFTTTKVSLDAANGGTVMGLRASYLREELARSLGTKRAAEVFSCR